MTLTDFLLARIAEVEEVAISVQESEPKSTSAVFTSLSAPTGTVEMSPARVLAECEAKRRIVSYCDMLDRGPTLGAFSEPEAEHARYILRALALPYAEHPDYDESWRP